MTNDSVSENMALHDEIMIQIDDSFLEQPGFYGIETNYTKILHSDPGVTGKLSLEKNLLYKEIIKGTIDTWEIYFFI